MESYEIFLTLAERYWSLANGVTGFSIAQMLVFLYSLGENKEFLKNVRAKRRIVFWSVLASGVLYSLIILLVFFLEWRAIHKIGCPDVAGFFLNDAYLSLFIRIAVVWIATIAGFLVLVKDRRLQAKQ